MLDFCTYKSPARCTYKSSLATPRAGLELCTNWVNSVADFYAPQWLYVAESVVPKCFHCALAPDREISRREEISQTDLLQLYHIRIPQRLLNTDQW